MTELQYLKIISDLFRLTGYATGLIKCLYWLDVDILPHVNEGGGCQAAWEGLKMREFIFRAWDKEKKIMIQDYEQNWAHHYPHILPGDCLHKTVWFIGMYYKTLMQFTGLKDSNQKQIFEGDIIKCLDGFCGEVYWSDDGFWVNDHRLGDLISCEMIGNIWENPELLS